MTAWRDPAVLFHDGVFHLFATYIKTEADGRVFGYTAHTQSRDLKTWSPPRILTPRGQQLNYCAPGNVVRDSDEWVLSLQSYPLPGYERTDPLRWGTSDSRIFTMRSRDLEAWSPPELLRVKGPDVARADMGRMIDPYLLRDKDDPTKWWCFYKQRGVSYSWSHDLETWTYAGRADAGENVCVLVEDDTYVLIHPPENGMGIKRSRDLETWEDDERLITLGQDQWPWAETRITAGFVLGLRAVPEVQRYVMFFHGVGPGKIRTTNNAYANCDIGIAWSSDLHTWHWPGSNAD